MQAVCESGDGDPPRPLGSGDLVERRASRDRASDTSPWHEERGGEAVRLALGFSALRAFVMPVQNKVAQLMRGIEPAAFPDFCVLRKTYGWSARHSENASTS